MQVGKETVLFPGLGNLISEILSHIIDNVTESALDTKSSN